MITLTANLLTGTMVTRKKFSYDDVKLIFPDIDSKISLLSNCNSGFSIRNEDHGVDAIVKDWVTYKRSRFNHELIEFVYYFFHKQE